MLIHFNWRLELHPIVAHFPIALLCVALLFDLVAWAKRAPSFRSAALYCLVAGGVGTGSAVVTGLLTPEAREHEVFGGLASVRNGLPGIREFFSGRLVTVHEHWGFVLLGLVGVWLAIRVVTSSRAPGRTGLSIVAGILALVVLLITGYYGGELVYRHRESGGRSDHHVLRQRGGEVSCRGGDLIGVSRRFPG